MKRKIYNVDPTPNPECKKLIDAYNNTCKNYNDTVKEYKNIVKDNITKCKKEIDENEKEKKKLEKEIKNIQPDFDAVALKFATAMPSTEKFKNMINMGVKFYRGNFNQTNVNGVQGVGMNLNDKNPIENANCYINYTSTTNKNGTKNYTLRLPIPQNFNPANAAKAIAVIVNLRHRNADLPNNDGGDRQRNTNRFLSEPELQKLGFVNDVVTGVKKNAVNNFVIENNEPVVTKRDHNGKLNTLKDKNGNYIVDAGGFKLIREFANDFINDKDSQQVIKDLKSKVDKDERLKTLNGLIAECKSYIKNELKNGIPINERRKEEKNDIDMFIKNFKKTLDNKMEKIKKESCTAPTKCVEPTLIR